MDSSSAPRGRGRGRGYGRGRGNSDRAPRSYTNLSPVPRIALLHLGTPVSIVLKMDQGSGREVKGFVGELLTRGDHPRGVKVRLRDGRVGRGGGGGKTYSDFRTDGHDESFAASNSAGASLEDYIVVKGNRKGKKSKPEESQFTEEAKKKQEESGKNDEEVLSEGRSTGEVFKSAMSTCPVCGDFEGDEMAVAHHVSGHFE